MVIMKNEQKMLQAIRAKCLDCSGGSKKLVERCSVKSCPLYGYRMAEAQPEPMPRRKRCLEIRDSVTIN